MRNNLKINGKSSKTNDNQLKTNDNQQRSDGTPFSSEIFKTIKIQRNI